MYKIEYLAPSGEKDMGAEIPTSEYVLEVLQTGLEKLKNLPAGTKITITFEANEAEQ